MTGTNQHDVILGKLGSALLALFCNQDRISDDDIASTISEFNKQHGSNLTWTNASTIIDRLKALYDVSPLPAWIPERYEFIRPLAAGATAKVFLAVDHNTNLQVAIKLLNRGESLKRVQRETEILQHLKSNYIVRLTDAIFNFDDPLQSQSAIVMEFVDGVYLNQVIEENGTTPHPLEEATRWMIQSAHALQDAHDQGVIHRDIKPANLVVAHDNRAIKLLDFGLASNVNRSSSLTNDGDLLGTPHYIAPEQSRKSGTLDERNDIYSYGATFYHLLTGTTPFSGDYIDLIGHHRYSILESPQARNPQLPHLINHVIEKCMAKNARDRFQSFAEILDQLRPNLNSEIPACMSEAPDHDEPPLELSLQQLSAAPVTDLDQSSLPRAEEELTPAVRTTEFQGGRAIQVVWGDLLDHSLDSEVVVVCDDSHLSMGGGTAKRILDAAGPAYFKATRNLAPAMPGRVITSTAGDLPHRFVFHAITIPRLIPQDKLITPTPDLIRSLLDSCFYHAQSLGVTTIAMPLLGTGYAGMSADVCYQTIMEHTGRELEFGLTPVTTIKLILPEGMEV